MTTRVTSWAGVDPTCEVCGKPATRKWHVDGVFATAACNTHKEQVEARLIRKLKGEK